ncbi:hypothetical protein TRVL_00534 [Trypanosoma vivax]|uniref:Uncharacterized protein n=1 Tax=Trypanosoma vivax (strain Y486) TaxID=1055687 RepID=G0UD47_TRYVY|nr:hypothetical protein TRVL_00534 [Trypanosoma vivax]CCC53757.1 hypothetical protein TVY486_1112410 [Trypanosoma vivax Y486]
MVLGAIGRALVTETLSSSFHLGFEFQAPRSTTRLAWGVSSRCGGAASPCRRKLSDLHAWRAPQTPSTHRGLHHVPGRACLPSEAPEDYTELRLLTAASYGFK